MTTYLPKLLIIAICFLALSTVGCGYGPDTSLPTDKVGPMLDQTTTPLTEWSQNAYRLAISYSQESREFWVLDVEEPTLYSWTPTLSAVASVQGENIAQFNDNFIVKGGNNPNANGRNITGFLISDEGLVAQLPSTELRTDGFLLDSDGPWFSPNGRWRVAHDTNFGLYSTGSPLTTANEERLKFGTANPLSVDADFAWILSWNPDSTQFVMSTQDEHTYLFNLTGRGTPLSGEAGNLAFESGQWLSDGRLILLKDEILYAYDTATNALEQIAGLGRPTWFSFSPDLKYLATREKVDCEYRADNSSWFPGNEYCTEDFFLYDKNLENRQRLTIIDRYLYHSPVWLPLDGIGPIWEVRSVAP